MQEMRHHRKTTGLERLIQHFENKFDIEENINYYSFKDFSISRRKYVKFMLKGAACTGLYCSGDSL